MSEGGISFRDLPEDWISRYFIEPAVFKEWIATLPGGEEQILALLERMEPDKRFAFVRTLEDKLKYPGLNRVQKYILLAYAEALELGESTSDEELADRLFRMGVYSPNRKVPYSRGWINQKRIELQDMGFEVGKKLKK